jgi:hypothetical protein
MQRKEERMIRNLKVLGLALAAVCALGATMASAASAAQLTSDGPVTLVGTQTGGVGANVLSAYGSTVECGTVTYTGHKSESTTTPKELIPNGATAVTIAPHYSACEDGEGHPVTVKMTSCDYTLTIGAATESKWGVTADLQCATAGDEVHVEVYNDEAHTERICTITFGAQSRSGAHILNTTGGHLGLQGTFSGITAKREGLCLLLGGGTSTSTATLTLDVTVTGKNAEGEDTAISIS